MQFVHGTTVRSNMLERQRYGYRPVAVFCRTSSFRVRKNCNLAGCQLLSGLSLDGIWSVMLLRSSGMFAPLPCSPRAARSGRAGRVFVQPSLEAQLRPLACMDPLSMRAACGRAAPRCVWAFCVQVVDSRRRHTGLRVWFGKCGIVQVLKAHAMLARSARAELENRRANKSRL